MFFPALLALLLWQDSALFRSDVRLVTIPCQVTDSQGAPVRDLGREEFRIFDNGVPQETSNLWIEKDLPLTLGIVIDISSSQHELIASHEAAVRHFIERMVRPGDRAFVATVAEDVILRSEVNGGPHGLREVLLPAIGQSLGVPCGRFANGRAICGGTALWNAVYASAERLKKFQGTKALLILSDGNDTGSTHTAEAALQAAQRANSLVYAIQYPDSVTGFNSSNPLKEMCAATGGLLLRAPTGEPTEMLASIESDLRSRYVLGFHPSESGAPQGWHEIRLEMARPGVTVRARRAYFEAP
jgi:VWFA-related protein